MQFSGQRGLYFEEIEVGGQVKSAGRTITEADIVNFAGISGDFNSVHTDQEYASDTLFGGRIAHGLLVLSIASGLSVRTGFIEGTVMAWRDISQWKFSKIVSIGDTVHVLLEVVDKKLMPRLGGGSIQLKVKVNNQLDETVMQGTWSLLVKSKPDDA
jgi:acyl dehydratase